MAVGLMPVRCSASCVMSPIPSAKGRRAADLREKLGVEAIARDRDVGDLASIPDAVTQAARQAVADLPEAEQSRVGEWLR
jgi:hypothetical protein